MQWIVLPDCFSVFWSASWHNCQLTFIFTDQVVDVKTQTVLGIQTAAEEADVRLMIPLVRYASTVTKVGLAGPARFAVSMALHLKKTRKYVYVIPVIQASIVTRCVQDERMRHARIKSAFADLKGGEGISVMYQVRTQWQWPLYYYGDNCMLYWS